MSYLEDTQVDLAITPQPKGKLPEVRIKHDPNDKNAPIAEMVTHLILHKYNKLTDKLRKLKDKILSLPFFQLLIKSKNSLSENFAKIKSKINPTDWKQKAAAQIQTYMSKNQAVIKTKENIHLMKNKFTAKTEQAKEDIQHIQTQIKDIVYNAVQKNIRNSK